MSENFISPFLQKLQHFQIFLLGGFSWILRVHYFFGRGVELSIYLYVCVFWIRASFFTSKGHPTFFICLEKTDANCYFQTVFTRSKTATFNKKHREGEKSW